MALVGQDFLLDRQTPVSVKNHALRWFNLFGSFVGLNDHDGAYIVDVADAVTVIFITAVAKRSDQDLSIAQTIERVFRREEFLW